MAFTDEQKANLSQELIAKAVDCETPEELIELAKTEGIDLTLEEAEAYLAEMDDIELDSKQLKQVAGGGWCVLDCPCYIESYDDLPEGSDCGSDCAAKPKQ